ncbi:ArsR/SmtB family transcription factor [Cytobacillus horneckiae]|uniref:ArsR/SmtB family transcription factor n=1 Tax=Cytobacillus horneckiae TaxID=549687 RepID=UPI003D9A7021
MELIRHTSRRRETYQIKMEFSLLWECALGIAAITNTPLHHTMEKSEDKWQEIKDSLPQELLEELEFVHEHNTWKALLQLLHQKNFTEIEEFTTYINNLSMQTLKFICLPFLGTCYQQLRCDASSMEKEAIYEMQELTKDNSFFSQYIEFISLGDIGLLKNHLISVMTGWYDAVIKEREEELYRMLHTDFQMKQQMEEKMPAEELVEWVTGGIVYQPEPSVNSVLLIPQYTYRPWNIEADIEETKVFYYPISNESIDPTDQYTPNHSLVLRYKALGDETRMKMIKLLFERDYSLQEITNRLDLGKTTAHHHLKILRSAKLVDMKNSHYSLKLQSLKWLNDEMKSYLRR